MSWNLKVERGRQTWHYSETKKEPSDAEIHLLQLQEPGTTTPKGCDRIKAKTPEEAVKKGIQYLSAIQTSDGHWAGDYGGPMFLLPGMLITCYVCEVMVKEEQKREMIRYLLSRQRSDGGWGLHIEAKSDMFGTVLQYVALRILGLPADHPSIVSSRSFIKNHGGAVGIPSWGKLWLAVMGVYDYDGLNPIPIELWLSPYFLPFAPGRMWCHCRMVYLPMSYIYAKRIQSRLTPLVLALRDELYVEPYEKIDWPSQRNNISPLDMYHKHSMILDVINKMMVYYEKIHSTWLRNKAVDLTFDHVRYEDEQTKYIDIGPVNKVMNMLCVWSHEGRSEAFWKHFDRLSDYLWLAEDGMKMQGYNGSQLWDTTFAVQAILESPSFARLFPDCLKLAHDYIDISQVRDNTPNYQKYFRHISKGAWPFSTVDHGWPISDCTAEGVKSSLMLREMPFISSPITNDRLADAINVILSLQNKDGGWASYENKRAGNWMELLNPSEVFHNIMIDYSYVECSSACIQAMVKFKHMIEETSRITKKPTPYHSRLGEINKSIKRGIEFIKSIQRPDGGWIGSWGICFTYGTWFGMEALIASGESKQSEAVRLACAFLVARQRDDGGWGESFLSNVSKEYVQHPTESHTVNTAWALLSLMAADYEDRSVIDNGIHFLMSKQLENGDYPQQAIIGVFNFNCMISYSNYKNIFPTWALARYCNIYHPPSSSRL